jgi:hypothetical protein
VTARTLQEIARVRSGQAPAWPLVLTGVSAVVSRVSERAAMIYQHEAQGADKTITNAIDTHVDAEQARRGDDEDGPACVLVPAGQWPANGPDGNRWPSTNAARSRKETPDLLLCHGAGDGNRTRTISLGS